MEFFITMNLKLLGRWRVNDEKLIKNGYLMN